MRPFLILLSVIVFDCAAVVAQEEGKREKDVQTRGAALQTYVVQLTEFRLKESADINLTGQGIAESFDQLSRSGRLQLIEIIRLSALEQFESTVQFGKMATVTVGFTQSAQGRSRNSRQVQIGTIVRLTAWPQDGKVLLKLSYETSRFEGEGTEESPPDTTTVQFNTTMLIEPGKPTLVGGSTAEKSTFLLVSVFQADQLAR